MQTDVDLRHVGFKGRPAASRRPGRAARPSGGPATSHQPPAASHEKLLPPPKPLDGGCPDFCGMDAEKMGLSPSGSDGDCPDFCGMDAERMGLSPSGSDGDCPDSCGMDAEKMGLSPSGPPDGLLAWVIERAGLDCGAYRHSPLQRRLPACLRALRVHSAAEARRLLEHRPDLLPAAVSSLLIGVTGFFRDVGVFEGLRSEVLPPLAGRPGPLRVWSAACSTGAELYSVAILLAEAGLLERSFLLGTDCRGDAIDRAKLGLYDAAMLKLVRCATRDRYFVPAGQYWRPVQALRRQVRWKAADLLAGVEPGPWDIILWRNVAIYLKPGPAETIWRRLAAVLAPRGALISGKAERPPADAGLTHAAHCTYRAAAGPAAGPAGGNSRSPLPRGRLARI